jgi:hypothetical protein
MAARILAVVSALAFGFATSHARKDLSLSARAAVTRARTANQCARVACCWWCSMGCGRRRAHAERDRAAKRQRPFVSDATSGLVIAIAKPARGEPLLDSSGLRELAHRCPSTQVEKRVHYSCSVGMKTALLPATRVAPPPQTSRISAPTRRDRLQLHRSGRHTAR